MKEDILDIGRQVKKEMVKLDGPPCVSIVVSET